MVYEPAEDSFLLQKFAKKYSRGLVLDMGTGSGIQALEAADKADLVIALDIDKDAIKYCKKNIEKDNIFVCKSNLFQIFEENFFYYDPVEKKLEIYDKNKVKDKERLRFLVKKQIKFDLIIFNPPYLPQELESRDKALEGGKKGYEILQRFFNNVQEYLKKDGRIIIVFSSFTKKQKVNDMIHKNGLNYVELEKKHIFFEDLYVYYVARG